MKNKYRFWIITLICICSLSRLQAQTDSIRYRLDSLVSSELLQYSQLGLMVYDLTADSVLYTYNARQTMRPASTMKLLTSVTALDVLGANYHFCTALYYTGSVRDSVLTGDVFCVGGMDPLFDDDDMQAFAHSVRALGIHTLRGRIVTVSTFKDADLLGEGWCWDDDNPKLTPLLINRKNEFAYRFFQSLDRDSIFVDGPNAYGGLPRNARLLCERKHALTDVLDPMMKNSDNLFAEAMFYQIGAATGARPAKASHARREIQKVLQQAGASGPCKIADGSGLSLYNYVSAELLTRLLIYAYRKPDVIRYLYDTLPLAGDDGTLPLRRKVR